MLSNECPNNERIVKLIILIKLIKLLPYHYFFTQAKKITRNF